MFGKRRRVASTSNPPQRAPPSASASLAATKAFVKDRESNGHLSSAAAAAALRTHVTAPTPVGDTITKRMVRRNSASSNGSGAMQRPGGLQRQSSSGSMTERTFRTPSPGRGSPADPSAPPVPVVPKSIPQTSTAHRRASSLEPAFRGGSPAPRGGGRGGSLDRGTGNNTAARGQRATSNLTQVLEDELNANRPSSVNFSRPMSPASAAKQNTFPPSKGWFGGPVVNQEAVQSMASGPRPRTPPSVASYHLHNTQQQVQNAADRPVRTHQVSRGVESSRLSAGSMRAKPSGTAVESRSFLQPATRPPQGPVDPKSPDAIFDPSTRTFIRKQDAMARHRELHEEPEQPTHQYIAHHVEKCDPQHEPRQYRAPRTPSPVRQPTPREESPPAQRSGGEVALPKLDTSSRIRHPQDPPTGLPPQETHASALLERQQSGNFADADLQPIEQANTSRKLESTVQPVPIDVMVSPKFTPNQDSSYPRLPPPVVPTTTHNVASLGHDSLRADDRGQSLSPPRNAHFAPVAVELAGTKHQPPPRSISPAKSALKASPSASRRGSSPVVANRPLLGQETPSEASDTTSEGGSKKKKRDIRVSFEEAPIVAGTSAYADAETLAIPAGLGASKWSSRTEKEDEFEDFMKPRPALPTFGSVRDRERRRTEDDAPEKVTETVSSTPMSASVGSIGEPLHASNDSVVGGVLHQEFIRKQAATKDPLPPEVTTVEGSGYVSDSSEEPERDADTHKHGAVDDYSQILPVPEPKSLTAPHEEKLSTAASSPDGVVEVPQIALLPATPSPFEKVEPKFQSMMVPGGWDDDFYEVDDENTVLSQVVPPVTQPIPAAPAIQPVPFQPIQQLKTLQSLTAQDDESSDDNSSVYSDAYEDLSDTEGGFGSINAIVESPVVPSSSGLMFSRHADAGATGSLSSGLRDEAVAHDDPEPATTPLEIWDTARQHWGSVNESLKQPQLEPSVAQSSHAEDTVARMLGAPVKHEESNSNPKVEPKPASAPRTTAPSQPPSQASQTSSKPLKSAMKKPVVAQAVPAVELRIRKTMRGPALREERAEPQMRSTMRTGANASPRAEPQMRKSIRGSDATPSASMGLAASRHSMVPVETKPPRGALQKRNIPPAVAASKARPQSMPIAPVKPVATVPTYDSDSDASASSFQRTRARGRNGGRTMRSSMRQDPVPTLRPAAPVRSISPPQSTVPVIRKSMRPSSPTPQPPPLSKFSIRSLSPMGRFRSSKTFEPAPPMPTQPTKVQGFSKQTKQKAPVTERVKPTFKSRIADSSDEDDDGRLPRHQSRFADSDSDEPGDYKLPAGLAPVRGIPRRAGEEDGDSTDLEEEADETRMPSSVVAKEMRVGLTTNGVANTQTNGNANGQGATLAAGSLRDSKHAPLPSSEGGDKAKTKRGFFGLGKKKTVATPTMASQPTVDVPTGASQPTTTPPSEIPLPPQQRNREMGLALTPIDEDKNFDAPVETSPQSKNKKAPKLQRRSTPEWPLPPVPSIGANNRPVSADGIASRRPRFQMRQSSAMSSATAPIADGSGRSVSYSKSGKKKKFQGLRRVFGLND